MIQITADSGEIQIQNGGHIMTVSPMTATIFSEGNFLHINKGVYGVDEIYQEGI